MKKNRSASSDFRHIIRFIPLIALVSGFAVLPGCRTVRLSDPVTGPGYRPQNIYAAWKQLPVNIRRVAVLPATCDTTPTDLQYGRDLLASVITEELSKTRKFEVINVTSEQLRVWTGRTSWRAEDTLPADLLKVLKGALECDAVLFSRVTQYRPYPPLTVGFSFKLVDAETSNFIWAADEVFDSSEPSVVNSARRYQILREQLPSSLSDSRSILNSPTGFGRYAANSVFETLPAR